MSQQPRYMEMADRGLLVERVREAYLHLSHCDLCCRRCGADRRRGQLGACRTGELAMVSSYGPHFGEESPLVGSGGSGTVFFAHCNLSCIFCQNYDISHLGRGEECTPTELAALFVALQEAGCHNLNLVSPTHVVPQIIAAIAIAAQAGFSLPIVYNTGGYDSPAAMRLLDGIVDIYMPDAKYGSSAVGHRLSGVRQYAAVNRAMVREAHRQVGDLRLDGRGIAEGGLLVRHLVLPGGLAGTREVVEFLAQEVSVHTYLNVMAQYRPCYAAVGDAEIGRPVTRAEHTEAVALAREHGLYRLDGYWTPSAPTATSDLRGG